MQRYTKPDQTRRKLLAEILAAGNNSHPLHCHTITALILPFLNYRDLAALKQVSKMLAEFVVAHETVYFNQLPDDAQNQIQALPVPLRHVVMKRMFGKQHIARLAQLLTLMKLNNPDRNELLQQALNVQLPDILTYNDTLLTMIVFEILSITRLYDIFFNNYYYLHRFNHPDAAYMLDEKFISSTQLIKMFGPGCDYRTLYCANGRRALRLGLLTITDVPHIQDLEGVLSDQGMALLTEDLINTRLIAAICKQYYQFCMKDLMHPEVLAIMRTGTLKLSTLDPDHTEDVALAIRIYKKISKLGEYETVEEVQACLRKLKGIFNPVEVKTSGSLFTLLRQRSDCQTPSVQGRTSINNAGWVERFSRSPTNTLY
jgi:hypothetical protein